MQDLYQPKLFHFKRHENLHCCYEGGLWRIQEGYVRSLTWSAEGESVPLGFWSKGDILGCALAQMHPYEAQCLTAVTAEYLGSDYCCSQAVILAQIRQSNDLLRIAHCRQSERRLLQFICWLASTFGEPTSAGRHILLKLTHQEIAESIGATRVTVTRLLKALERNGKISWTPHEKMVYRKTFEEFCKCF
ncbi:Crp/Fnr family transcriptional regulator [Leptolyngbya sp. BC1307]|uniref:Crp/Fnr family transcriptional regulator n=1 Tax=Leptolyngbya sp. BC1307 TaxID=2029589 RepID=UPI000EFDA32E|nr:Crp/Fnr family transcriptional regulator [Leptolyngbya sp. BC1307]